MKWNNKVKGSVMEGKFSEKKALIFTIIVIIALVLIFGLNIMRAGLKTVEKEKSLDVIPVKTDEAKKMEIDQILELTGNIRPQFEVEVSYKIPGKTIEDIFVETGDRIQAGEKIAVLEKESIDAKRDQVRAALELARSNAKQADTNLDVLVKDKRRLENLFKEKAVSRQQLDHMEAQVKAAFETKKLAQSQINQAQATLNELNVAYQDHTLVAPISGYISKRYVDKGAMSTPGAPVVRISDEDILKIVVSVTEKDFIFIKKGMPVEIGVDALPGKVIKGAVTIIGPTINPATRTGEIEIHIANTDRFLRGGMFARVKLYIGKRQATVINRDGLLKIPGTGGYFVYVAENGKAVQKNIETGISQENLVEVTSGLAPGEQVIVTGQNRIRDGVQIAVEKS
jgi:RND family efflux transporter MFP subunit